MAANIIVMLLEDTVFIKQETQILTAAFSRVASINMIVACIAATGRLLFTMQRLTK